MLCLLPLQHFCFCDNSFAVNAVVLGKLTISPAGPIIADVGSTVVVDCSSDDHLWPNVRWFRPVTSLSDRIEDILAQNATVMPRGESRIGYAWTDEAVLRLFVSSAMKQDSGTYWCILDEQEYHSVTLVVTDTPRLQQNVSGWHLILLHI